MSRRMTHMQICTYILSKFRPDLHVGRIAWRSKHLSFSATQHVKDRNQWFEPQTSLFVCLGILLVNKNKYVTFNKTCMYIYIYIYIYICIYVWCEPKNLNTVYNGHCIWMTYNLIHRSGSVNSKPFLSQFTGRNTNLCVIKSDLSQFIEVFFKLCFDAHIRI